MKPTVIILEPSRPLRRFCIDRLDNRGVEIRLVDNVSQALAAICEDRPALVLTSAILPDLPARSLVAALEASPHHRAIPVVILTADASQHPGSHHVTVIAKDRDLGESLDAFLDEIGLTDPPIDRDAGGSGRPTLAGCRILLAEDSHSSQRVTGRILHVAGAHVVMVSNGREALEALDNEEFDLVLMDIEMPEMDGRDATRTMRIEGKNLPILALTAQDSPQFLKDAEGLGFDAVILKSTPREELVTACIHHLAA
jgi:CheY-like chemotaxis protein